MEVEVKLSLPNLESHARFKTLISQSHLKTVNQHNLFFDIPTSALSTKRAVLCTLRFLDDTCCVQSVILKFCCGVVFDLQRKKKEEIMVDWVWV
ncbi:Triphosphate tunnel metalloenzyme 3 [Linum grandiflorum]